MRISRPRVVAGVCLCAALAAPDTGQAQPPAASAASFARARTALDSALRAAGGREALQSVKDVRRSGSGTVHNQGQSLRPEAPLTSRPLDITSVLDFAKRRSRNETTTVPSGGLRTRTIAVLAGETGFAFNELTGVATTSAPGALQGARTALRRDPAALLLTADSRAETLRSLGEHAFDGRPHEVVTFAEAEGAQVALYVDARTSLLSKYETLADNAVLGDVAVEVVLSDHRPVGGVTLPFRVVTRVGGEVTQDLAYSEIKVNAGVNDPLFEPPAGAQRLPALSPATVELVPAGDGVYFVTGGSHNSLLVVFQDHLVLVEAPQGEERSQAVIAKIREVVGDTPIRYVVPTHYHFDHSGGLRAFVAQGSTILTTAGNRAFVERLAAAPHTLRPDALARAPRAAVVETFTGKRTLTDGARILELYDVGPSPHVDEMVVAYLPQEQLLFVADLFGIPAQGPLPPAGAATRQFAARLGELGLAVERIASGHGRLGTIEDLRQVVATAAPR